VINVKAAGKALEVRAPYYPDFASKAKGMGARCQAGVWRFSRLQEGAVREALWEVFGTDGAPVETVTVQVALSEAEADEASVWGLGRRLVRRAYHDAHVQLDAQTRTVAGVFPAASGASGRPTLGHRGQVVLEVRQVPRALAEAAAQKDPARYRGHVAVTVEKPTRWRRRPC
jgi:hypothetical protein